MAVTATAKDSVLVATYQIGLDKSGGPILRQKSFPNVSVGALDQDVFDVANALFALQQYPLTEVRRDNRFELVDQAV